MKKTIVLAFALVLASCGGVFGQPPGGKGGPSNSSKIQGKINQGYQSGKLTAGEAIGLSFLNGINRLAEQQNRPPHHHPHHPPHRPPYGPPRPPQSSYYRPPARTVYVQAQPQVTPTASARVETAQTVAAPLPPPALTPNPARTDIKKAPKEVIRKIESALKKKAYKIWEPVADELEKAAMDEDKAAALAKQLIDEGKDTKKVAELLVAIEKGEADLASKLITELTEDPLTANKISKEIKFGELLSEITDQISEGDFDSSDLSSWKKAIGKMKLPTKQQKAANKGLAAMKEVLELIELFSEYKENSKWVIAAPTGPVSIIYCPTLGQTNVYALDENVFVAGTNEDDFWADEASLDMIDLPPAYSVAPIPQTREDVNSTTLVNETGQTATYYLDDGATRQLVSGTQAAFEVPGSATVSLSSGGRKRPFTVEKGRYYLSYDGGNIWSLKLPRFSVTLDNSDNPLPLECYVNRSPHTVPAGGRLDLKAESGVIDIQFARDENASNGARYQFDSTGTYKIGIGKQDGKWALFPAGAR